MRKARKGIQGIHFHEVSEKGNISIENINEVIPGSNIFGSMYDDALFSIQVAEDGRAWVNVNGISFLRFKPARNMTEASISVQL